MESDWPEKAFFLLHQDLPREGPGEPADIAWVASLSQIPRNGRICEAACGPGGDLAELAALVPEGNVIGFDLHAPFANAAAQRHSDDPRIRAMQGQLIRKQDVGLADPRDLGQFDLIWCAGACYFEGVTECLDAWRAALKPGGVVAFSEVAWFVSEPAATAQEFWNDYPGMTDEAGVSARVSAAGHETLGTRRLSDRAWENYYGPLDERGAQLRVGADEALSEVLDEGDREARLWRTYRRDFGYLLSVVRPV